MTDQKKAIMPSPLMEMLLGYKDREVTQQEMVRFVAALKASDLDIVGFARIAERDDLPIWAGLITKIKNDRLLFGWLRHNRHLNGIMSGETLVSCGSFPTIFPVVGEGGTMSGCTIGDVPIEVIEVSDQGLKITVMPMVSMVARVHHIPDNPEVDYIFRPQQPGKDLYALRCTWDPHFLAYIVNESEEMVTLGEMKSCHTPQEADQK